MNSLILDSPSLDPPENDPDLSNAEIYTVYVSVHSHFWELEVLWCIIVYLTFNLSHSHFKCHGQIKKRINN